PSSTVDSPSRLMRDVCEPVRRSARDCRPTTGARVDRYLMIALGGAAGALARYQLAVMIQSRVPVGFPWGTFVVNVTGCLVMGIATTLLTDRLVVHPNWRFLIPI